MTFPFPGQIWQDFSAAYPASAARFQAIADSLKITGEKLAEIIASSAARSSVEVAVHGTQQDYARPDAVRVIWAGSVTPLNALSNDLILNAVTDDIQVVGLNSDTTAPAAPGLTVAAASGSLTLTLTRPPDPDFNHFQYRYATANPPTAAAPIITTATTVTIPGLTNGTPYYVQANSVDSSNLESAWTAVKTGTPTAPITPGTRLSGASGSGIDFTSAGQGFAGFRGTPVTSTSTWSDNSPAAQTAFWQFDSGFGMYDFTGSMDVAVGAIFSGESWASAASGAYDSRWSSCLTNLKSKYERITRGQPFIRFAHEMNGTWYPWSVTSSNAANFKTAWARFRTLQQSIWPASKLVFCVNGNSTQAYATGADGSTSGGWGNLYPGDSQVDVIGVDWYSNHWAAFGTGLNYDGQGGAESLPAHFAFAVAHSKPFCIPEWGNNSDNGDQPAYIDYMADFFATNAGINTAGKLWYENYFNVIWSPNKFGIYPKSSSLAPNASDRYVLRF